MTKYDLGQQFIDQVIKSLEFIPTKRTGQVLLFEICLLAFSSPQPQPPEPSTKHPEPRTQYPAPGTQTFSIIKPIQFVNESEHLKLNIVMAQNTTQEHFTDDQLDTLMQRVDALRRYL